MSLGEKQNRRTVSRGHGYKCSLYRAFLPSAIAEFDELDDALSAHTAEPISTAEDAHRNSELAAKFRRWLRQPKKLKGELKR